MKDASELDYSSVRLVVWDFDGVFTDNSVYTDQNGVESVKCHRSDGIGITNLQALGIETFVLSKERNPVVTKRCQKLNIQCFQSVDAKGEFLASYFKKYNVNKEAVVYVGNDINDIDAFAQVGIPLAVRDRYIAVDSHVRALTTRVGGHGAVREVCDLVARAVVSAK